MTDASFSSVEIVTIRPETWCRLLELPSIANVCNYGREASGDVADGEMGCLAHFYWDGMTPMMTPYLRFRIARREDEIAY